MEVSLCWVGWAWPIHLAMAVRGLAWAGLALSAQVGWAAWTMATFFPLLLHTALCLPLSLSSPPLPCLLLFCVPFSPPFHPVLLPLCSKKMLFVLLPALHSSIVSHSSGIRLQGQQFEQTWTDSGFPLHWLTDVPRPMRRYNLYIWSWVCT